MTGDRQTISKRHADVVLVERGLASSRSEAQAAIAAGSVRADGRRIEKPAQLLDEAASIDYAPAHGYVSRAALKLEAALERFNLSPRGLVCLDIGTSTGGFTEVLLGRGAAKVYAVDVGHGQLHSKLRGDPRIVLVERTNARALNAELIPEALQFLTVDVSFISLKLALPPALSLAASGARLVALVKPQFEIGRARLGKGGVVRDAHDRENAVQDIASWFATSQGWIVEGVMESPIAGGDGNREVLIAARKP